ncbi:MAG: peptidase U32 family protein [Bacteroidales bacterium]
MRNKHNKPELLLPASNPETFFAAVEGGANAVYSGLKKFNARARADNFTFSQLQSLLKEAKKNNIKVFLTLNTVIKNEELVEIADTLHMLAQTDISALIIQDWGVYHLIKNFFQSLKVHASTQMGNHNSLGGIYADKKQFERVIFARELTPKEIHSIQDKSNIEIELFAHGALCYSFSGMCLFSSFLGGMSANRGQCMQPCRRLYESGDDKKYLFSLKDNELIDFIPTIMELGVSSIKIEGRLKPAEYMYNVGQAYRMAIDDPSRIPEAKALLKYDMGREKSSYFFGGNVKESVTDNPTTGIFLGAVKDAGSDFFTFPTRELLKEGNRLWIRTRKGKNRQAIKLKDFKQKGDMIRVTISNHKVNKGDQVYLANLRDKKFPSRFKEKGDNVPVGIPDNERKKILQTLSKSKSLEKEQRFLRIDSIQWLKKVPFQEIEGLIINLIEKEWRKLDTSAFLMKKNMHKIFFELPKFIPEYKIPFYESLLQQYRKQGYRNYMISHLSQQLIIPKNSNIATNENVYIFNDAAIQHLTDENIKLFCYPLENDLDNLKSIHNKKGIVPVYFYPELFYSRMPVKSTRTIINDEHTRFSKVIKNGNTIIIPESPVSFTQYKDKLSAMGYGRFLIDVSHEKPSDKRLHTIINRLNHSEQIQPSSNFNMKTNLT